MRLSVSGGTAVTNTSRAPMALPQTVDTTRAMATDITRTGMDPDGDVLTCDVTVEPEHGALTGDGAMRTYTPDAEHVGDDTFESRVGDGTVTSSSARVLLKVGIIDAGYPDASPLMQADAGEQDAGVMTEDASAAEHDAGPPVEDGGVTCEGAAVTEDAGDALEDASVTTEDGGLPTRDSGTTETPGVDAGSGGGGPGDTPGFGCEQLGGQAAPGVLAGVLALLVVRRRRR